MFIEFVKEALHTSNAVLPKEIMRKFSASPQIKLLNISLAQALKQKNYQSAAAGGPVGGVSHAPTSKYSSAAIFQNTIAPKPPTQVIQQPAPPQIQQPAQHHQHHQSVDYDAFFSPILGKVRSYNNQHSITSTNSL